MKKFIFSALALLLMTLSAVAQRPTDRLDRGLVAIPANANGGSGSGIFVSWRIFAEEYYDVTYNLYCNGSQIAKGLKVSNYTHTSGTTSNKYQVAAVVKGVEQELCEAVSCWSSGYKDIPMAKVENRNGADVTAQYIVNDVSLGDVDGDGVAEFIVKRNYTGSDLNTTGNTTNFHHYECYNLKGERLWWIDLGPNMMAGPDEQWDIVAFDWDQDGKAECIMRGADNMIIHTATGETINVGSMSYVAPRDQYTCNGNEYLLYINGETGEPYNISGNASKPWITYPLPRYESGESDYVTTWGPMTNNKPDGGHRSSKHYFGAPFLDGRKPSIFLGRGCYTRHKMVALDVDPVTHLLTERWRWANNGGWSDPWFGNGYHNFGIADVDEDGRDEIVFGSMIIDDNGKGLSTTGLGHGDAQHCGDFDPYRKGLEFLACNEDEPNMNYRNATTSKIYYRSQGTVDDGRALCGNFSNDFPGCMGRSVNSGLISTVADRLIENGPSTGGTNDGLYWSHLNFRIYWTGDLLEGILDSPGTEREAVVWTVKSGRVFQSSGCKLNNDSKNNPCAQGDIFGDWREEIVVRTGDNAYLRIYTTPQPTAYRIPTLWHDHQYRNAMVWQCVGYNQPPHTSFFLGEMEGITQAPPPYTMTGRVEVANGGTIAAQHNGQHVIVCETGNTAVTVAEGATPDIVTFNVPSWVQGTNSSKTDGTGVIKYDYYTCNVSGAAFSGDMRLVKQGDGILNLPAVEQTYTGETNIWAGTLNFDGTLKNSDLWLNRFAELNSNGGEFKSVKMEYASVLRPGAADNKGNVKVGTLALGMGARVVFDIYSEGFEADQLNVSNLTIGTQTGTVWETYGPKYLTPVFEFNVHTADNGTLAAGSYLLGEVGDLTGNVSDIKIEGIGTSVKTNLSYADGKLYLVIKDVRDASYVFWNGNESSVWEFGGAENFTLASDPTATSESFITGDIVTFNDDAAQRNVSLKGEIEADSVIVDASKAYKFTGTGSIVNNTTLVKRGSGTLTISTDNTYTGGTRISGGTVSVSSLSNSTQEYGNLGGVTTTATKFVIENGATLQTTAAVTQGSPMQMAGDEGGVINNSADFNMNKALSGTLLTKRGSGWLKLYANSSLKNMVIAAGAVNTLSGNPASTVELQGGALYDDSQATTHAIVVPKGKTATWHLTNTYYTAYANKISGEGTLIINPRNTVSRVRLTGNWSTFTGTIKHTNKDIWLPLDASTGLPNGTLDIAEGCGVTNVCKSFTIGKLTGKGSLNHPVANFQNSSAVNGSNTWKVGNSLDELGDFTFEGTIADGGSSNKSNFEKVGTCKMTVKGVWTNSGTVKVSAGELRVASGASLGTGTLTVAKGAMLSGVTATSDDMTNSSYTINGTLAVGATATAASGVMNFGGKNVTFGANSVLRIGARRCATATNNGCASIANIGRLTMNGTVQIFLSSSYSFAAGDSIRLWTANTVTGTPKLESNVISEEDNLYWDDSRLAEGLLFVVNYNPVAIRNIGSEADPDAIYTVQGIRLGTSTEGLKPGIYIRRGKTILIK